MLNVKKNGLITIILNILIISGILMSTYAHDGEHEEGEENASYYGTAAAIWPPTYVDEGMYFTALLVCGFWIGIIGGFYNLCLMLLARLVTKLD